MRHFAGRFSRREGMSESSLHNLPHGLVILCEQHGNSATYFHGILSQADLSQYIPFAWLEDGADPRLRFSSATQC